eukprot:scaffold58467_cov29-Attheya_sp.AAC.1
MAEHTALRIARQSTISRPTRTRGTSTSESADDGASNGLCMCSAGQKCAFLRRYGVHFTSFILPLSSTHALQGNNRLYRLQASRPIKDNSYQNVVVGVRFNW